MKKGSLMKKTAIVFMLLGAVVVLAGCTTISAESQDITGDAIRARFEHHGDWTIGIGCYEKVNGYAYNAGTIPADRVVLGFNLINTRTSTIRDSQAVFIGTIPAGQSVTFETDLNGECMDEYQVVGTILR